MNNSKLFGRKFILVLIGAIIIYSIFLIISDINLIFDKLLDFDLKMIPLIMIIIFSSWLVLFMRWNLLLKNHQIDIPLKDSLSIYLAGFTLAIAPLRTGEFVKSILLKNKFGIKRTVSVPIIFLERFYDIIGTFIIAIFGILFLGVDFLPAISIALIGIFLMFLIIYSKSSFNLLVKILLKFKFAQKFAVSLETSYDVVEKSSRGKVSIFSTALTMLSRLIEGMGIYLVLLAMGIDIINYLAIVTTYSASVIIGTASLAPGGIGVTEGSLAGLMSLQGIELSTGLVIAMIIRFFTLWFTVGIGAIALKISRSLDDKE